MISLDHINNPTGFNFSVICAPISTLGLLLLLLKPCVCQVLYYNVVPMEGTCKLLYKGVLCNDPPYTNSLHNDLLCYTLLRHLLVSRTVKIIIALKNFICHSLQALPLVSSSFHISCYNFFQGIIIYPCYFTPIFVTHFRIRNL